MIIRTDINEVKFAGLDVGDYVIVTTASGSTYRLTVAEQLYTKGGWAVSTIVKVHREFAGGRLLERLGAGIITRVKKGCSAIFTEAAGYKYPFRNTSPVNSLALIVDPEA